MKIGGRAKKNVWISATTVIVDIVLDFFLIYGYGKTPALGANGSAYSTVVVEAVALIWCIVESYQKDHIHPDNKSMLFFSKAYEKDLWKIAFAMLSSSLSWGLSITAYYFIMGHLGTDATAAYSVTSVTQQLIQCLTMGLSSGAGIMIGKRLGNNLLDEAKEYGWLFWKVSLWSGLISVGILCVAGPLVLMF